MRNLRLHIQRKDDRTAQLEIVGSGRLAYLWIGVGGRFVTTKSNGAALRRWLRAALKRMDKGK